MENTPNNNSEHNKGAADALYTVQETPGLNEKLALIDARKTEIDTLRPIRSDLWPTIEKKLRVDWTYDSNAIEGSTLTRGDTFYLLEHGITVEGKPLKDFLDARNHADAIDFLHDVIANRRPISPGLIKEINALLLLGVKYTDAINEHGQKVHKPATPGEYKRLPNHVLRPDGTLHHYVEPIHVPAQIEELTNWIEQNINQIHPIVTGALAHYNMVRVHPFDDGNGRGARILMNLILMKKGLTPAIIQNEKRKQYIESLVRANEGDINPLVGFVADSMADTQNTILENLRER